MINTLLPILADLAHGPSPPDADWLVGATHGVDFMQKHHRDDTHIILHANSGALYIHSCLIARSHSDPMPNEAIRGANLLWDDTWHIEHIRYGNGKSDVYIEEPLRDLRRAIEASAEPLLFLRSFAGVREYEPGIELSQKLVHALDLYCMDGHRRYCRLDGQGNEEVVIEVLSGTESDARGVQMVTIEKRALEDYMALTETVLLSKFDFTRTDPHGFDHWGDRCARKISSRDLHYCHLAVPGVGSYAYGHIAFRSDRTIDMIKDEWSARQSPRQRTNLASWMESPNLGSLNVAFSAADKKLLGHDVNALPQQLRPAFFRIEVLSKYKMNPDKYLMRDDRIVCRGAWVLKSVYINTANQVHAFVGDLAELPEDEQLHWRAHIEEPRVGVTQRALQNALLGEPYSGDYPIADIRQLVSRLNSVSPVWWRRRGSVLIDAVSFPVVEAQQSWIREITSLDHLLIEAMCDKGLKTVIRDLGDKSALRGRGVLYCLECALKAAGWDVVRVQQHVGVLKEMRKIRGAGAHGNVTDGRSLANDALREYGTLWAHYTGFVVQLRDSMNAISECLLDCSAQ